MMLRECIDRYHGGNITAFAESIDTPKRRIYRQQVQRWLSMNGIWTNGNVYEKKSKLGKGE